MNVRLLRNRARLAYTVFQGNRTLERRPRIAYLLIENRCNLACFYCFVDINNKTVRRLETEDIFRLIDQLGSVR